MKKSKKSKATTRGVKASKVSSKAAGWSSKSGVKKKVGGRVKKGHEGLTAARGLGVDTKPWAKVFKGLEEPPITFKALKSVRDELLHHSMAFESEVRGEFSKVRGEMSAGFEKVDVRLAEMTKSMNKMMESMQKMQVEQEEVNQRSNAALDAFLLMKKEADVNSKRLEEKTNHRLNVVEIAVKDLYRRDKPASIE